MCSGNLLSPLGLSQSIIPLAVLLFGVAESRVCRWDGPARQPCDQAVTRPPSYVLVSLAIHGAEAYRWRSSWATISPTV
ncbi:hypothetical protein EJ06DRAFT_143087 [Trichodelitschia bisporula]|uniref:Secreted protein n=1 Tax=Trichodelitschia bisporula TaxID=703511 RepID=A0A6G1HPH7_9PEZI|nr:hypothetical protein EJ06DRAFT_143087 [Trichodelitschia bisporula]